MKTPMDRSSMVTLRRLLATAVCFTAAPISTGCGSNAATGQGQVDANAPDSRGSSSSGGPSFQGGDGSPNEAGVCASVSKQAEKIPLDMAVGLDTSFSMIFDDKWTNVKAAMKSFVGNPSYADLNIGLQFFPIRAQCNVSDYQALAVDLAPMGQAANPISVALDGKQMAGGTPTVPLLEGLIGYLKAHPNPAHKPVILLATDGVPDDACVGQVPGETPNTLANAIAITAAAYAGTPSISTFVIGVGTELTALNGIAQAGGTGAATLVDTGGSTQQQFLNALDAARKSAIPCDFAIPADTNIDPTQTNVDYAPASGGDQTFLFVNDAAGCVRAPNNGWYFNDPTQPTKVVLCPSACDTVKADDRGQVNVVFGCPRFDAPR